VGRPVQASLTLALEAGGEFARTITKNTITQNYIFSLWMKPAVSGNIDLVLKGSDNMPHTYPVAFTNTAGVWKYYEIKVPVSALSTTFTANFKNMAASAVPIDDVLFYPENAEVATFAYDGQTKAKIAETNTNGVARYFVSDQLGRLNLVYDQDKQITDRKSYSYIDNTSTLLKPAFSANDNGVANIGTAITFYPASNYNTCTVEAVTYHWNFGDGTTVDASSATPQTHSYSDTLNYTVTLTVIVPGYTSNSFSSSVKIHPPPPPPPDVIPVLYVNNTTTGASLNTVRFFQSNVLKYTFTAANLAGGTVMIPAGTYTVYVSGTGTIGSVSVNTTDTSNCRDQPLPNGSYSSVLVSLINGNSITITLNDGPCM
jgi:hypothetical protein